jgi:hypothetical protein
MSRQTDRADLRYAAKVNKAEDRVASRVATRKDKRLTPLSADQLVAYPAAFTVPYQPRGKTYANSNVPMILDNMQAAA